MQAATYIVFHFIYLSLSYKWLPILIHGLTLSALKVIIRPKWSLDLTLSF